MSSPDHQFVLGIHVLILFFPSFVLLAELCRWVFLFAPLLPLSPLVILFRLYVLHWRCLSFFMVKLPASFTPYKESPCLFIGVLSISPICNSSIAGRASYVLSVRSVEDEDFHCGYVGIFTSLI